jgi:hypothetical protein
MATINSLDDFLQALDANPSWREAVRARILGEELLQLPARFDVFMERQLQFNERIEGFIEEQKGFNERMETFVERMETFVEQQARFNERAENFMDLTDARMNRIESDISVVKGGHARTRVADFTEIIAANLDLDFVRTLTPRRLHDIARNITDPTAANPDQRDSFVNADLVIEGADGDGQTVYIAVETSWTADRRDSGRARRNARYLTDATGHRAIAAVASVRNDNEVTELISRGEVHWHRIPDRDLEPA